MTISTYATLKDAVLKWLLRANSDLVVTDTQLARYIQLCEKEMNRRLKENRLLFADANLTIAEDTATLALPTNYSQVMSFEHSDDQARGIDYVSPPVFASDHTGRGVGRPDTYTIIGTNMRFAPTPDADYEAYMLYRSTVTALSDTNTTNVILTAHPDLYLYGSLKHAYMQIKDQKELENVSAMAEAIFTSLEADNVNSLLPAGTKARPRNPIG